MQAGLPNITGNTKTLHVQPLGPEWSGNGALGLQHNESAEGVNNGAVNAATIITFNAGLSNAIYGASNTVQPPALSLIPQIRF